jgi:hypothetical protein
VITVSDFPPLKRQTVSTRAYSLVVQKSELALLHQP